MVLSKILEGWEKVAPVGIWAGKPFRGGDMLAALGYKKWLCEEQEEHSSTGTTRGKGLEMSRNTKKTTGLPVRGCCPPRGGGWRQEADAVGLWDTGRGMWILG